MATDHSDTAWKLYAAFVVALVVLAALAGDGASVPGPHPPALPPPRVLAP